MKVLYLEVLMDYNYVEHYELMAALATDPRIIESAVLYNFVDDQMYAALMDRMSQAFSDGSPSPLSSRSPGSGHSILAEAVIHIQSLQAHEINLMGYLVWIQLYRMLGVEIASAEYPVINLVFKRTFDAINSNLLAQIPLGTEIRSTIDPSLVVYTIETAEIMGQDVTVNVPARLNRRGTILDLRIGEFTDLPRLLAFVESVTNDGVVYSQGREKETLSLAMLRGREEFRIGKRCVTLSDYYTTAMQVVGAKKCNVVRGYQYGTSGTFNDLVTVVIYPGEMTTIADAAIRPRSMEDDRLSIIAAEIIPIDGDMTIRVVAHLSDNQAFDLAAQAIIDKVNPPSGIWQNRNLADTLVDAIEQVEGIYAVTQIHLKNSLTNVSLENIEVQPWHLFEIKDSFNIKIIRN